MANNVHESASEDMGRMWIWVLAMAVVVILAAILGFTDIVAVSAVLARVLFLVMLAGFLATIVMGVSRRA